MKLPISWLNEYVQVEDLSPKFLADKLLNIGFEVEEIINLGEGIENVVVGKILDIKKHPEADKLSICLVDVGKEITTIITGANNIAVGNYIPVALDGAKLPGGKEIFTSELRGVKSYGMMCSGKELNVTDAIVPGAEVNGILILRGELTLGEDIKIVLGLNDYVLDVSLTANRPDCQSIYGLAREIGAALERKIKPLTIKYKSEPSNQIVNVKIKNYDACTRYTGTIIEQVKIEESPLWLKRRLSMCGIRPINNIVDITNYVLLEVGQPLHAFDLKMIEGSIIVRNAQENEQIKALNDCIYNLTPKMLVIADEQKSLAIAGVMGGEYSGISAETKSMFLESARFARGSIRSTSRQLGLRSDSSARYEKGVDWQSIDLGRDRALTLIQNLKAGKITSSTCSDGINPPESKIITTTQEKISSILGIKIKQTTICKILKNLGFEIEMTGKDKDVISCTVPLYREDVDNFTDLAEEIIRFYGYDKMESTLLKSANTTVGGLKLEEQNIKDLKNLMVSAGCYEIYTYSFINNKVLNNLLIPQDSELRNTINILNPLSEEYSSMRTQLAANLLQSVYLNLNRKNDNFRLFEIGKTYVPKSLPLNEMPIENNNLSLAFVGKNESFYTIKETVENALNKFIKDYELQPSNKCYLHPGISADILVNGKIIGWMGRIHPTVEKNYSINSPTFIAEICLSSFIGMPQRIIKFEPLPKYPIVERDLAIVINKDLTVGEIIKTIKAAAGSLCNGVELFDVYMGEQIEKGFKSVAFSIKFMADRTLVDAEITESMDKILTALKEKYSAQIRE